MIGGKGKSAQDSGPQPVIVRDANGHDVTPRSLNSAAAEPTRSLPTGGSEIDPLTSMTEAPPGGEAYGGRTLERSHSSAGSDAGDSQNESISLFRVETKSHKTSAEAAAAAQVESAPVALTESDLDAPVVIELRETSTFWLLEETGTCVATDSILAPKVAERNDAYAKLLKARHDMADMYVERAAQTFSGDHKVKEVQTPSSVGVEMGTQASGWDIYDTQTGDEAEAEAKSTEAAVAAAIAKRSRGAGGSSQASGCFSGDSCSQSGAYQGSSSFDGSSVSASMAAGVDTADVRQEATPEAVEASIHSLPNLPSTLRVAERVVSQNAYHKPHLAYRNIMQESSWSSSPGMEHLWGFQSEESAGRNVSCLEWNPVKHDMLAVAYGEFDFSAQRDGLILFWSLKNPSYPDKIISVPCGVTCIAFSREHPNLLAAGLYDGTVCVYDIRKDEAKPTLESGAANGKHTDPVWALRWVDHGAERGGEHLVSISTDGRVMQWNMKKGLEQSELMMLKRVAASAKQGGDAPKALGSEGIISRRSAGLCIDFCPKDPNIYIAGTEDGHLHKCSCSYSEQYLESYFGHAGPVYKLRWSPFCPNTFVSCSADWTVKLWNAEVSSPVFSLQSGTDYVADVCWSHDNSTVFASATGDGRVDVWDLAANTLDPIKSIKTPHTLSCVSFARSSPVLVTGNASGVVDVYQLTGTLAQPVERTAAEQLAALEKVTATVHNAPGGAAAA